MRSTLFGLILLATSANVCAWQATGAGSQIQQIPTVPAPPKPAMELRVDPALEPVPAAATDAAEADRITVRRLLLTGHPAFDEATLLDASGFRPGTSMTLAQLRAVAAKIADYYRQHGYFLARAFLPPQDVKGGVVTIAVLEGRYAGVTLRNRSAVADSVAHGLLDGLEPGDSVLIGPLETRLLLLSDLPAVRVKSTLVPGAAVGSTELMVDLEPGPRVNGSIDADNHGNRYTGKGRIGASVNVNQLSGYGDVLSLRAMTSAKGLNYGRLAYQMQARRTTAGVAYARMVYELGEDFAALDAHGTADIASLFASYPLARSRNANLVARLNFDHKTLRDRQDVAATVLDKKARVLTASMSGELRDQAGGGGVNSFVLAWNWGKLDIESPLALALDGISARTNGNYGKLGYSLSRSQNLAPGLSLYGAINGQSASKNLDASEKMGLGGARAVRAYPEGEAYADNAAVATLELKKSLAASNLPGQLQAIAFIDAGRATIDKSAWSAGRNHRRLSGAGIGLAWTGNNALVAKAFVAHRLGHEAASSAPDQRYRFIVEAVKYF